MCIYVVEVKQNLAWVNFLVPLPRLCLTCQVQWQQGRMTSATKDSFYWAAVRRLMVQIG